MSKSVHIKVPKPCHENWQNMTPKEQGRFCGSCKKMVVDFTNMGDKELLNHISKAAGQSICGRFAGDQLNRNITVTKNKRFSWTYVWNVLLATFLFTKSYGQEKPQVNKKPDVQLPDLSPTVGTFAVREPDAVPSKEIRGTVIGHEFKEPLEGATVMVKGTTKGTVTDSLGRFTLMVADKSSVTLEVIRMGYETQIIKLNKRKNWQNVKVIMKGGEIVILGEIAYTEEN